MLYEVRKDAMEKARGVQLGERCFSLMYWLENLAEQVRRHGLLTLDCTTRASEVPPEIGFFQEIQLAGSLLVDGTDPDLVIEILTARYWAENYQGEDAFLSFMIISGFLKIQAGYNPRVLEDSLKACLPGEAAERYEAFKERLQRESSLTHQLLNSEPISQYLRYGRFRIVKELLEEKIDQADTAVLKKIYDTAKEYTLIRSFGGLSSTSRKKLLSVLSVEKVSDYEALWEKEYIVMDDIIEAMAEMVAILQELLEGEAPY